MYNTDLRRDLFKITDDFKWEKMQILDNSTTFDQANQKRKNDHSVIQNEQNEKGQELERNIWIKPYN